MTSLDGLYSSDKPHRRFNILTGEWVLVSPHRSRRPWLGQTESLPAEDLPAHNPECYLCPGGTRAGGIKNPDYTGTFVFTNDFAALLPEGGGASPDYDPLFQAEAVRGTSRVICFSPRHDLTLPKLPKQTVRDVVDVWAVQSEELGRIYRWVQVFENKGAMMGCSNPHPHCQIWASDILPTIPAKEEAFQANYLAKHGSVMLRDVQLREEEWGERVVLRNDQWTVIVPYWASWPFETLLLPRTDVRRLSELNGQQRDGLADILMRLLAKYDNLYNVSFPYSMGWHGAPYPAYSPADHWLLHAHVFPPLLRSATVKKFMVGYEMLAEPQRDLTPEQAAERLRELPEHLGKEK
ncbi:MAG: UDP-glucose--hexose-1-phosphate uridylyltransferase [bacterium]